MAQVQKTIYILVLNLYVKIMLSSQIFFSIFELVKNKLMSSSNQDTYRLLVSGAKRLVVRFLIEQETSYKSWFSCVTFCWFQAWESENINSRFSSQRSYLRAPKLQQNILLLRAFEKTEN